MDAFIANMASQAIDKMLVGVTAQSITEANAAVDPTVLYEY
jgi:hypothetical protein